MERHEHFESLASLAAIGEADGAEVAELETHLRECPACRQAYGNFLSYGAVRMIELAERQEKLTGPEAIGYIDSALFREKFMKKAEAEGILPAPGRGDLTLADPAIRRTRSRRHGVFALGVAASALVALSVVLVYHKKFSRNENLPQTRTIVDSTLRAGPRPSLPDNQRAVSELERKNRELVSEVLSLKISAGQTSVLAEEQMKIVARSETERNTLLAELKERETNIADLERQFDQAQTEVRTLHSELDAAQTKSAAELASNQERIRELSDQLAEQSASLDREREMLAANRDIRDLMSARNLHIADIFDTDTKGRTRAAFGRVFFTEGKSLLIYAYDLNDKRVQEAGYTYRVWGKKEGPGQPARSLGIFYSDDKAQKRWVFQNEDPKVLNEIDSVFVTLEPPGTAPTEPKGEKFLYAYLRNQPNHP